MSLKSKAYANARKILRNPVFASERLLLLLVRVITRREKVSIFLGNDDIDSKEEKTMFSLLSAILDAEKKIKAELKECIPEGEKERNQLREILNK